MSDDEEEMRRFRSGEDVRYLPLTDRKLRLRRVVPKLTERLLYCDHIEVDGQGLFQLACQHDLEGIVAKVNDCGRDDWSFPPGLLELSTAALMTSISASGPSTP